MLKKYFKLIVGLLVLTTVLAACNPSKPSNPNQSPKVLDQSKLNIGIQMQKHRVEKQLQN